MGISKRNGNKVADIIVNGKLGGNDAAGMSASIIDPWIKWIWISFVEVATHHICEALSPIVPALQGWICNAY